MSGSSYIHGSSVHQVFLRVEEERQLMGGQFSTNNSNYVI